MAKGKKRYTLFLDESETSQSNHGNPFFCMAGIIVADDDITIIQQELNELKRKTWGELPNYQDIILHQMNISNAAKGKLDITKYPEYARFRAKGFRKQFNNNFAKIFDCNKIKIVGGSVNEKLLNNSFAIRIPTSSSSDITYRNYPDKSLITLQLLLENYCQFLCARNGLGRVIYESLGEIPNERLRDRFYNIKLMGSMYITKEAMSNYLLGIDFIKKECNNPGLQIADFIPNAFARNHAGFNQIDNDNTLLNKLMYYRYNGTYVNDQDRFGIKYMP